MSFSRSFRPRCTCASPPRTCPGARRCDVMRFVFGYLVYVPIEGVAGRYVVPGVWGLDILLGVFFAAVATLPASAWKRVTYAAAGCAVIAVVVSNIGKQTKAHARIDMLWDVLE